MNVIGLPADVLPRRSWPQLLRLARTGLVEAAEEANRAQRFATAHVAALRAASAVIVAYSHPAVGRRRGRPPTVWELLPAVAPELASWASRFGSVAAKKSAAQAGISHVVSVEEADELLRDAERFVALVELMLAPADQPTLSLYGQRAG